MAGNHVNPEVVKKYVLDIRKALRDHPENPAFVATFPKRGYKFIAVVREDTNVAGFPELSANTPKTIVGQRIFAANICFGSVRRQF